MLCRTRLWSAMLAPESMMDSLIRTPGPIRAPAPTLTFGPSWNRKVVFEIEILKAMQKYRKGP